MKQELELEKGNRNFDSSPHVSEKDVSALLKVVCGADYTESWRIKLHQSFDFGLYVHRLWQSKLGYISDDLDLLRCKVSDEMQVKADMMCNALLSDSIFKILSNKDFQIEVPHYNELPFYNTILHRNETIKTKCRTDFIVNIPKFGKTIVEYKTLSGVSDFQSLENAIDFFWFDSDIYHYLETTEADTYLLIVGSKKYPDKVFKKIFKREEEIGKGKACFGYSNWNLFMP